MIINSMDYLLDDGTIEIPIKKPYQLIKTSTYNELSFSNHEGNEGSWVSIGPIETFTTYQNDIYTQDDISPKSSQLNVNQDILNSHGAVSEEVALEMARGVRSNFSSDIGISTTGIAGPSGGSKEKPVGLVYVSISSNEFEKTYKFSFTPYRKTNKLMTSQAALNITRRYLLNGPQKT